MKQTCGRGGVKHDEAKIPGGGGRIIEEGCAKGYQRRESAAERLTFLPCFLQLFFFVTGLCVLLCFTRTAIMHWDTPRTQ